MPPISMSSAPEVKKKKVTKLEKICELKSKVKLLKDQNKRLNKELASAKQGASTSDEVADGSSSSGEEKLKEALRALNRVTMKQEMSLSTLRAKARQRRQEIEHKDRIIENLEEENRSLQMAYQKLRGIGAEDEAGLRSRLFDLELQLAKQQMGDEEKTRKLKESDDNITSLRDQLDKIKGRVHRAPSSRSLKSADSSGSNIEDVAKLKRELAKKVERIANLEYDLEIAQDEIHELKRKKQFDESFPLTPAPGMDDFFDEEEDEEEDDYWGT